NFENKLERTTEAIATPQTWPEKPTSAAPISSMVSIWTEFSGYTDGTDSESAVMRSTNAGFKESSRRASAMTTANGYTGCRNPRQFQTRKQQTSVPLREMQYENRSFLVDVLQCEIYGCEMKIL